MVAHPSHSTGRIFIMRNIDTLIARRAALRFACIAAAYAWVAGSPAGAQVLAGGGYHNCATTVAGGVVCWGGNSNGQIGDNSTIARAQPVNVIGLPFGSTAIAAGHGTTGHTCALVAGAVKCWGANNKGQLGDNSTTQRLTPVDVTGLGSGMTNVSAGDGFSCALSSTGGVSCWGRNNNGQMGGGDTSDKLTPITGGGFGPGSGVSAISGSSNHVCVVNNAGGAVCWGANFGGQLGDGNDGVFLNAPVAVIGLSSGVTSVATGSDHSCALTTTGGVKCWGDLTYGAIGNGNSAFGMSQPTPVDVTGLNSGVTAITAGQFHSCALTTTGGVKCWGRNAEGQIGDGTTTQRNAPVDVIASGAIAIAGGATHTCVLFGTGVSSCWGANVNGQIGIGVIGGPSYVPVATIYPAATTTMIASNLNPSVFGDAVTFTATVTGGVNGVAVAFQLAGVNIAGCSGVALASGTATCTTSVLNGGTRSIAAIYLGNSTTLASTSAALSQVVNPAAQTITFDPLANKQDTDPAFIVSALATSGLAVSFSSNTPGVCTVSGSTVTIVMSGTCTIAANQSGNSNFGAAPTVVQSFSIVASGPPLTLNAVVSRKTHATTGTFDLPIALGIAVGGSVTVESRSIGTGHRIVFQFDRAITSVASVDVVDSALAAIGTATPSFTGSELIITITGIPDNRRARVTVNNVNGSGLSFPVAMGFFIGDINSSRAVNITDVNGVKLRAGQLTTSANFRFDVNASGAINITDVNSTKLRAGQVLVP